MSLFNFNEVLGLTNLKHPGMNFYNWELSSFVPN